MSSVADKLRAALDGRTDGREDFSGYIDRPGDFAHDVLGVKLWAHQLRTLDALVHHRRVAWRSSHGVGKSITAASAAAWWISTRPESIVILTAPSYRQVRHVDWRAVGQLRRRALVPLGGEFHDTPEQGWRFSDGREVVAFSAGDPERFAGFHAANLLAIVDESSGVDNGIFEALKGALTGSSRLLLLGNPTQVSGEFYDAFGRKAHLYHGLHTSAYDVPNVSGVGEPIEGLIDQTWLDEMKADYGEESAIFAVRALGEFPTQAADAVISLAVIEAAKERYFEIMRSGGQAFHSLGPLEVGCDPARFGDDTTCIVVRRGPVALAPIEMRHADVTAVAQKVAEVVAEHRHSTEQAIARIDATGVGGGVADILRRQHSATMTVVDVNAGAAAKSPTYQRCRDELWFSLRDWLRNGGAIPPNPRLEGELAAPTFSYSPAQKLVVESKDDTRKRLRRSPDAADALALAVYKPAEPSPGYDEYVPSGFTRRM